MTNEQILELLQGELTAHPQIIARVRARSPSKSVDDRVSDWQMLHYEVLEPLRNGQSDEEFLSFCGGLRDLEIGNRRRLADLGARGEAAIEGRRPINAQPWSRFEADWCADVVRHRHEYMRGQWLAHAEQIVNILEGKQ